MNGKAGAEDSEDALRAEPVFAPPSGFAFPPEFTGEPPRTLPESLNQGPYARGRRMAAIGFLTFGLLCLAGSRLPGVPTLACYVLPLGYLSWIGLGSLAVAALSHAEHTLRRGPYRYVREGQPLMARVVSLVKAPSTMTNGQPSTHAFTADIVFRDPATGTMSTARVKSRDFASARKERFFTPFRRGDYVTAVYLPGDLARSLRLYAFLDLSPAVNLRRQGLAESTPPWKAALMVLALVVFFAVLLANVYAFGRYQPIDFAYRRAVVPMAAGAVLLGGALLGFLYLSHRREGEKLRARAQAAHASGTAVELHPPFLGRGLQGWVLKAALAAGAPLLGAGTALCWCFMANAWLDRSAPRSVPARVEAMKTTTHAFLFREYELEYRLEGSSRTNELLTTPQELDRFHGIRAIARVRDGGLGWPWAEAVVPETPPDP